MRNKENKIDIEKMRREENPSEYQEALIFKHTFQQSKQCLLFRIAWDLPAQGFNNQQEYSAWHKKYIDKINIYYKSDGYKKRIKEVLKKKRECEQGKINDSELQFFIQRYSGFANPQYKYQYDIDQTTIHSCKPIYWREYIEECILFKNPTLTFPMRPMPEPRLEWDNMNQSHCLIIENIFSDTTTKDFSKKVFTKKFMGLRKKLPGYNETQPRLKKSLDFGLKVLELDKNTNLTDWEKAEEIEGEVPWSSKFGVVERYRKNKVKQSRHRAKKYLGGGSNKEHH